MTTLFDRYVVVDWSARNAPAVGADSVWIADLGPTGSVRLSNPHTRRDAERALAVLLDRSAPGAVLLAIDVALGYPAGSATLLALDGPTPWRSMWDAIAAALTDDERNRNNRFEVAAGLNIRAGGGPGPFWGCPTDDHAPALTRTKPPPSHAVSDHRLTEHRLRAGGLRPASVWQLFGAGSVGGQTLTAIPMLRRLLASGDHPQRRVVWPFTTGLEVPVIGPGCTVVSEIWPSRFLGEGAAGSVKDAAQVAATAGALRRADRSGELVTWFAPAVDSDEVRTVVDEEGWVLGPPLG